MKRVVWKYTLAYDTLVDMPLHAQVLSVHAQNGDACLWALVDPDAPLEQRQFLLCATGKVIITPSNFVLVALGAVYSRDVSVVHHVFEVTKVAQP